MPVSMPLKQFLAMLATDSEKLADYLLKPDEVMNESGLSHDDMAVLRGGDLSILEASLDEERPGGAVPDPPFLAGSPGSDLWSISHQGSPLIVYDPPTRGPTVTHAVAFPYLEERPSTDRRQVEPVRSTGR
jgi:hypothetical protein